MVLLCKKTLSLTNSISETRQFSTHPVSVLPEGVRGQVCVPGVGTDPDVLRPSSQTSVQVQQQEVYLLSTDVRQPRRL